jgi:hypothetical protein
VIPEPTMAQVWEDACPAVMAGLLFGPWFQLLTVARNGFPSPAFVTERTNGGG